MTAGFSPDAGSHGALRPGSGFSASASAKMLSAGQASLARQILQQTAQKQGEQNRFRQQTMGHGSFHRPNLEDPHLSKLLYPKVKDLKESASEKSSIVQAFQEGFEGLFGLGSAGPGFMARQRFGEDPDSQASLA